MRRRSFLALAASLPLLSLRGPALARTPVAVDDSSALMGLLRLLPDDAIGETGLRYANYDVQLAALGVEERGAALEPERWSAATSGLTAPMAMMDPLNPDWRDGLGFDLRDVTAFVEAGTSDNTMLVLGGRFDAASLTAAWEAGGYAATETDGVAWHTLGEDNVLFDPDVPLSSLHLGALSHLALLDGGTVVGTAKRADMERVLARRGGEGESVADGPAAALAVAPADLVTGWIVGGLTLVPASDPLAGMAGNPNVAADVQAQLATQAAQMAEEAPRMPPIALALVGATAGTLDPDAGASFPAAPRGHAVAIVVPVDEADGAMVAETVTRRLTTQMAVGWSSAEGRPWTEIVTGMVIDTSPSGGVLIDLTPAEGVSGTLLVQLLQGRQLTILAWVG